MSSSSSSGLSSISTATLWSADGGPTAPIPLPICFVVDPPPAQCSPKDDPGTSIPPIGMYDVARAERAIELSWGRVSRFTPVFSGLCDRVNDASQKVVIWIYRPVSGGPPYEAAYNGPTGALTQVNQVQCPVQASLRIQGTGTPDPSFRMDEVSVHDFGHILGWEHEHMRPEAPQAEGANWNTGACKSDGFGTPDVFHTGYDPDSVMNYCRYTRSVDGRLSEMDVAGTRAVYGGAARADADFDGWDDISDNCPYVANGDQSDSNFEAERALEVAASATPPPGGEEGRRPVSSDPQAYKDRWHEKYRGDACDPVATTRGAPSIFWVESQWRTEPECWRVVLGGGVSLKWRDPNTTCKIRMSTDMRLEGQFGGPAGLSADLGGTSRPSFCKCPWAQDPNNRVLCQQTNQPYQCSYGNDGLFPVGFSNPPGNYRAISKEGPSTDTLFDNAAIVHVNPMPGFVPRTVRETWAFLADLPAFDPNQTNDLEGLFWTHVVNYPRTLVLRPSDTNLRNAYVPMKASWDYGARLAWVAPFARKWIRIPYCDPSLRPRAWGVIPYMVAAPLAEGQVVAVGQDDVAPQEITGRFSPSARTLLALSTSKEILVADDRVSGQPGDAVGPNAVVVDTGTTRIVGAFTMGIGVIDGVQPQVPVGTQATAVLRAYAAREGLLYSLEGGDVVARSVADALAGVAASTTTRLEHELSSPRALAYSRGNRLLYALDTPSNRLRLSTIDPQTGTVVELGRTRAMDDLPATVTLSTTVDGDVIAGFSGIAGDPSYHVVLFDHAGRPRGSLSASGVLHGAPVGHAGGITIPLEQSVTEMQPNMRLVAATRTAMTPGACASAWMRDFFSAAAGATGVFATGLPCD